MEAFVVDIKTGKRYTRQYTLEEEAAREQLVLEGEQERMRQLFSEEEAARRKARRKENLFRARLQLDELQSIPSRRPENTDEVLRLLYDILQDMEG